MVQKQTKEEMRAKLQESKTSSRNFCKFWTGDHRPDSERNAWNLSNFIQAQALDREYQSTGENLGRLE